MSFGNIYWLYAFLSTLLILLAIFYYSQKKRHLFFTSLVSPKLKENLTSTYSPNRYLLKSILLLISIFLLFVSLAQPRWGSKWEEQKSKGIDVLFALDVSKSMLAQDVKPNRLERAKYAILDITKKLEGDRLGLIAFAGTAFLQCPLTLDYNAFKESLDQTDPSIIFKGGTNIASAINAAQSVFAKENNFKILILITDGEDLEKSGINAAEHAAKNEIKIYTVGVGTQEGELIPIENQDHSSDYLRDRQGKIVKTKLDEETLQKIATITKGFYVPLGTKGEGLEKIYQDGLKTIPKQKLSSNLREVPLEQFQWPLGLALMLLYIETLLSTRKKSYFSGFKKLRNSSIKTLILVISIITFTPYSTQLNAADLTDAYKAYQNNQFNQSTLIFQKEQQKKPEDPVLNYNLGNSLYKNGNYTSAIQSFKNAIKTQDLQLQQKSFYNLGNALFRSGEEILPTNSGKTIELWENAIQQYQNGIELDPQDIECKENLEFVKKKLEELKQEQEKQNQEDQQDQNQDSQNNENNSKQSKSNSDKNEDSENPQNTSSSPENQSQEPEQNNKKENNSTSPQNENKDQDHNNHKKNRQMNKTEAENLLKIIENSEKKLPAFNKEESTNNNYEDYNDW